LDVLFLPLAELLGGLPVLDQPHLALDVLATPSLTAVTIESIEVVVEGFVSVVERGGVGVFLRGLLLFGPGWLGGVLKPAPMVTVSVSRCAFLGGATAPVLRVVQLMISWTSLHPWR
jgi:hypothetical protein